MEFGLRRIAAMGAVILIGVTFVALSGHAQDNTNETNESTTAQPAAMAPENEIEADEGDHHEG